MARQKPFKYKVGKRPYTVWAEERPDNPGGPLRIRLWDTSLCGGRGNWRKKSLGHRDRALAKKQAREIQAKLVLGAEDIKTGRVTLSRLFRQYERHRTPRKSASSQVDDKRRIKMWQRLLGSQKDPHHITLGEWEGFIDARTSGAIGAFGVAVPADKRKTVRARTVEADLKWLRYVLNWGSNWKDREGRYLLRENCVRGYETPKEPNPRRPVASQDRYETVREHTDKVEMKVSWYGKQRAVRLHLKEVIDLANETGRRLSAILQLTYDDLRLDRTEMAPYGSVRWPAATDKSDCETVAPMSPKARAAINRTLADRPGIGSAPLFPSPLDVTKPVTRHLADKWLRKAEKLADLEPQKGSLWHAYRRKWAVERKHMPDVDVAEAGGWKSLEALRTSYQQPDEETMLRVVLGAGELRERKA